VPLACPYISVDTDTRWRQSEGIREEEVMQHEGGQSQAALMELQAVWEMESRRGPSRATEGSRGAERETKERSCPTSTDQQHTTSTPALSKQHQGPGLAYGHMQE